MNDEHDELKRELEEIKQLRRTLQEELAEIRQEKEQIRRIHEETRLREELPPRGHIPPPDAHPHKRAPPPRPHPPRHPPRHGSRGPPPPPTIIDFEALAESLEEMMTGLGEQIRMAVGSIRTPPVVIHAPRSRWVSTRHRSKRRKLVEAIPPTRIARVLSPLGNVERLRILEFLKDGGKSFNEIETYIGKTGSSLTHHLSPLIEAGYVIKGAVRGTYYITVTGRLAYRLAQWLTSQVEHEMNYESTGDTEQEENGIDTLDAEPDDEFDIPSNNEEVE